MLIKVGPFGGVSPRVTPRLLADALGTTARDVKLWNGSLRPWGAPLTVATVPSPGGPIKTLYRFGQDYATDDNYWFAWDKDVDVVRSPTGTGERTFFTGDGLPKVTDSSLALTGGGPLPNAAYTLGVPSPTTAPGVGVTGSVAEGETSVDRFYVYTFVNSWGEEGGVSPVSAKAAASGSQTITISGMQVPSGAQGFVAKRIYGTAGAGADADFFFVAEVSAGASTATFTANVSATPSPTSTGVGELLKTGRFAMPPADLRCLRILPGPILAGLSGNVLRLSEAGYPYAFPAIYEYPFEFDPVAIGVYGRTVVVATKGVPYMVDVVDSADVTITRLEHQYACVSKRSMCEIGGGVVYASPDGLVLVDQSGVKLITADHLDRDQWQALKPESMMIRWWDNRLVVFYDNGATRGSMLLDPGREPVFSTVWTDAAYVDPLRDALYIADTVNVKRFDAGAPMTYLWRSKLFGMPKRTNFSAAQVTAAGPVTMRVYADDVLRFTKVVSNDRPFRLPGGFTAYDWQIELEGTAEVFDCVLAETMPELRGV